MLVTHHAARWDTAARDQAKRPYVATVDEVEGAREDRRISRCERQHPHRTSAGRGNAKLREGRARIGRRALGTNRPSRRRCPPLCGFDQQHDALDGDRGAGVGRLDAAEERREAPASWFGRRRGDDLTILDARHRLVCWEGALQHRVSDSRRIFQPLRCDWRCRRGKGAHRRPSAQRDHDPEENEQRQPLLARAEMVRAAVHGAIAPRTSTASE
ncbi:MAG: hypothetical protein R3F56_24630 [Planctomycetota bacterium]